MEVPPLERLPLRAPLHVIVFRALSRLTHSTSSLPGGEPLVGTVPCSLDVNRLGTVSCPLDVNCFGTMPFPLDVNRFGTDHLALLPNALDDFRADTSFLLMCWLCLYYLICSSCFLLWRVSSEDLFSFFFLDTNHFSDLPRICKHFSTDVNQFDHIFP